MKGPKVSRVEDSRSAKNDGQLKEIQAELKVDEAVVLRMEWREREDLEKE